MTGQIFPQELLDALNTLREQGWNPQLCDTPIPHFDGRVPCGAPSELLDCVPDGYTLLPQGVQGLDARFTLSVRGDSMRDVGINDGDELDVLSTPVVSDGDVVVAVLDGASTVKMFFTDTFGRHWLVPRNKAYESILIEKCASAYILGRVVKIHKDVLRGSFRELNYLVTQSPDYAMVAPVPVAVRMEEAVRRVAPKVKQRRQWYAVFRALVDRGALDGDDYGVFVDRVCALVPDHSHLPTTAELHRMEVQSFRRAVKYWDESDAPVSGVRFNAYVAIAKEVLEVLS